MLVLLVNYNSPKPGTLRVSGKERTMDATLLRDAEGKYRTNAKTKEAAAKVYARWGLSLSDAINVFLVKSVEVGGLPFSMRPDNPSYEQVREPSLRAPLDASGIAVLPADWDDDE